MKYMPGDPVTWVRTESRRPQKAQLIPAIVSHYARSKIVIKIKDLLGSTSYRQVSPDSIRHRGALR